MYTENDSETGEQTTVAAYFERTYAKLRFPHLPCLHVGSSKKHVYLPMEVCKMVAQRRTKKLADHMLSEMNAKTCIHPGMALSPLKPRSDPEQHDTRAAAQLKRRPISVVHG